MPTSEPEIIIYVIALSVKNSENRMIMVRSFSQEQYARSGLLSFFLFFFISFFFKFVDENGIPVFV